MTDIEQFRKDLLAWYKKEARDLPWRRDPTPYKVLISELMLQQTRVDTVIPYYNRFIDEIPDIQALSAVDDERLLKLWQGLGYYSRAIRLKKAAQIILGQFGGQIPSGTRELQSLPGIGAYTAGAVASIAFGIPVPAVDGNVLRIAARLTACRDAGSLKVKKQTEEFIRTLIPPESAGDFNQALMDLGAGICLPGSDPACAECPVREYCDANRLGIVSEIPVSSIKKERKTEYRTVLIVSANGKYALRKRKGSGLLANLWEFPNLEGTLTGEQCEKYLNTLDLTVKEINALKPSKHIFTHLEWHMTGYFILSEWLQNPSDWIWATKEEISRQYSVPTAFKSYILFCCNENN